MAGQSLPNATSGSNSGVGTNYTSANAAIKNIVRQEFEREPQQTKDYLGRLFGLESYSFDQFIKRIVEQVSAHSDTSTDLDPKTPDAEILNFGSFGSYRSEYYAHIAYPYKMNQMLGVEREAMIRKGAVELRDAMLRQKQIEIIDHLLGTYIMRPIVSDKSNKQLTPATTDAATATVGAGTAAPIPISNYLLGRRPGDTGHPSSSADTDGIVNIVPHYLDFHRIATALSNADRVALGERSNVRGDLDSSQYVCLMDNEAWLDFFEFNEERFGNRDWFGQDFIRSGIQTMNSISIFPIVRLPGAFTYTDLSGTVRNLRATIGLGSGGGAASAAINDKSLADAHNSALKAGNKNYYIPAWNAAASNNTLKVGLDSARGTALTVNDISSKDMHKAIFLPKMAYKFLNPRAYDLEPVVYRDKDKRFRPAVYTQKGLDSIRCWANRIYVYHWTAGSSTSTKVVA